MTTVIALMDMDESNHSRRLVVAPTASERPRISASLLRSQAPLIESFPLAAYYCDVDDAVICYNQECLKFWGVGPSLHSDGASFPNHSMFASGGRLLAPDFLPSAIALRDPPMLHGLSVDIEQLCGIRKTALLYARLAVNECGTMVGVFCALIDPDAPGQIEAAMLAAKTRPHRFMEQLAIEAVER